MLQPIKIVIIYILGKQDPDAENTSANLVPQSLYAEQKIFLFPQIESQLINL